MPKITKTSSRTGKRLHNSFVERTRELNNVNSIEGVNPINPANNETAYPSPNQLITSDEFYSKLEALKGEYKKFYHNERSLHKTIQNLKEDKERLLETMEDLLTKYNRTILSLEKLDMRLNTRQTASVVEVLATFKNQLNDIGIFIHEDSHLRLNKKLFITSIEDTERPLDFLFHPIRGMIIKLYKCLRRIKVAKDDTLAKEYDGKDRNYYSGMIVDKRY